MIQMVAELEAKIDKDKHEYALLIRKNEAIKAEMERLQNKVKIKEQLLRLIERVKKAGDGVIQVVRTTPAPSLPPPSVVPKSSTEQLKLRDIDPLELARQLTIMESEMYQRIGSMDFLNRAREQQTENIHDNITVIIKTSNKIALWVAKSIVSQEDAQQRVEAVKHLISVADHCRQLNNFSTTFAIMAGLNTPPIRRLKRTWEQVNHRYMGLFSACESIVDSNRSFSRYRFMMTFTEPPCVPFLGLFLSTLQFIQDGSPDTLRAREGSSPNTPRLVNFRKRQQASKAVSEIRRWQGVSYDLHFVPAVQVYIEASLNAVINSERLWELSLEREPREREDERMARLLQESGFL
ncbi:ras guanine nucleotide exchange factor domain-containing protein [Mycena sanguinolenta]|nr:ras guanine nucleotide exchange factor domain-containing protein [Mycena sanguinolenta]